MRFYICMWLCHASIKIDPIKYAMQNSVKVLILSDEESGLDIELKEKFNFLKLDHYKVDLIENAKYVLWELEKYDSLESASLQTIVLIDDRTSNEHKKRGIEIIREMQNSFPDVEVILMVGEDNEIPELEVNDTYRLFKYPFELDSLAANIRLASRKNRKTLRRREALKSITEANELIIYSTNIDEIFSNVVTLAPKIVAWSSNSGTFSYCHFAILEKRGEAKILKFHEEHHEYDVWQLLCEHTNNGEINLDGNEGLIGIIGLAAHKKQTLKVDDVKASEYEEYYINLDDKINSQLAVPILLDHDDEDDNREKEVFGVINLEHPQPFAFDESDVEALKNLANQIAIAYKKEQIANRSNRQTEALKVLHKMGHYLDKEWQYLSEDKILANAVAQANILLDVSGDKNEYFTHFETYMPNENKLTLKPEHNPVEVLETIGESDLTIELDNPARKIGIVGLVAKIGKSIRSGNVREEYKDVYIPVVNINSQLSVPVIIDKNLLGVLSGEHQEFNAFSQQDEDNLVTLVHQVEASIKNLRVFKKLEQNANILSAVHEASQLIHNTNTVEDTLQKIVEQALAVLDRHPSSSCFAHIRTLDSNLNKLKLKSVSPESMRRLIETKGADEIDLNGRKIGVSGLAAKKNTLQLIFDVNKPKIKSEYIKITDTTKAQVSIPLQGQLREVIGVLSVETDDPSIFNEVNINALKMLADAASSSLISANLLAEAQQKLIHWRANLKTAYDDARKRSEKVYNLGYWVSLLTFIFILVITLVQIYTSISGIAPDFTVPSLQLIALFLTNVVALLIFSRADKAERRFDEKYQAEINKVDTLKILLDESRRLPSQQGNALVEEIIREYMNFLHSSSPSLPADSP